MFPSRFIQISFDFKQFRNWRVAPQRCNDLKAHTQQKESKLETFKLLNPKERVIFDNTFARVSSQEKHLSKSG